MKRILTIAASLFAVVGCSNPVAPSATSAAKVKSALDAASQAKSRDERIAVN